MKKRDIIYIIIIMLLFFIGYGIISSQRATIGEAKNLQKSLNDTLKIYKNKNGEQVATISVLETVNTKTFTELEGLSAELQELQKLVKDNAKQLKKQGSATIVKGETKLTETVTTVIISNDTLQVDSFIYIYPQYLFDIDKDSWVKVSGVATRDTTIVDLVVINEYSVVIGQEKQGLFKAPKPFVEVTNKNPYSSTTSLRTYQVSKPKSKKFGVGPHVGYGVNVGFNGKVQHGLEIGIGVQYNLIRF